MEEYWDPDTLKNECAISLGHSSVLVGGCPPDPNMTLGSFIDTYGRNGVVFTVSTHKKPKEA
jgi:hypothetical protein